jgi:CRP-like cAMP-binding protein
VALPRGKILLEAGEALTHAYFVEAGVVGLATAFRSGATAVSALVGREGVVGVGAMLGGDVEVGRYVVHVTGSASIMETSRFRAALRQTPRLRTTCQAYANVFLGQVLQNTACQSTHTVAERCARSLLVVHDRSNGGTIALTHESLAQMLGVPESNAASMTRTLQEAGMIRCSQEGIRVLDRARLEAAACECYGIDRARYHRLLTGALDRRERSQSG